MMGLASILFGRREFIAGSGALAAAFAALVPKAEPGKGRRAGVSPMDFGAKGDGVSNDAAALRACFNHAAVERLSINGQGKTFASSETVRFEALPFVSITSLRICQTNLRNGRCTLGFSGTDAINVSELTICAGTRPAIGDMGSTIGFHIKGGKNHRISNVDVSGQGKQTFVRFEDCADSVFSAIRVHNCRFDDTNATDDVVQGIHLHRTRNCRLLSARVANLTGNAFYYDRFGQPSVSASDGWSERRGWSFSDQGATCEGTAQALVKTGRLSVGTRYRLRLTATVEKGALNVMLGKALIGSITKSGDYSFEGVATASSNLVMLPRDAVLTLRKMDLQQQYANLRTRGIAAGGNRELVIDDPQIVNTDQAIDISGSDGNTRVSVRRGTTTDCGSVGVKFANSAVQCSVIGHVVRRAGMWGFLVSGPTQRNLALKTQDCTLADCQAFDIGYNNIDDDLDSIGTGIEVQSGYGILFGDFDRSYPHGIHLIRCKAEDTQARRTMAYGFLNEVPTDSASAAANTLTDCVSHGHLRAVSRGFGH